MSGQPMTEAQLQLAVQMAECVSVPFPRTMALDLIAALRAAWQERDCAEAERHEWQTKYGSEHCRDCCCARLWRVLQNPLEDEAGHDGLVGAVWELRTRAEQAATIAGDAKTQNERLVTTLNVLKQDAATAIEQRDCTIGTYEAAEQQWKAALLREVDALCKSREYFIPKLLVDALAAVLREEGQ